MNLTAKGRGERERWLDYGAWLRANSGLESVGAPGVATWGEHLAYGAVLGAAPKAADALGLHAPSTLFSLLSPQRRAPVVQ